MCPAGSVVPIAFPLMERVQQDRIAEDQVQKNSESDPQATQGVVTLCSPHPGLW